MSWMQSYPIGTKLTRVTGYDRSSGSPVPILETLEVVDHKASGLRMRNLTRGYMEVGTLDKAYCKWALHPEDWKGWNTPPVEISQETREALSSLATTKEDIANGVRDLENFFNGGIL